MWYADFWKIARIDIETGGVVGWYDFSAIRDKVSNPHDVFNGIAVDASAGKLVVTGKWFNASFVADLV